MDGMAYDKGRLNAKQVEAATKARGTLPTAKGYTFKCRSGAPKILGVSSSRLAVGRAAWG